MTGLTKGLADLAEQIAGAQRVTTDPVASHGADLDERFSASSQDFVARIPAWWTSDRIAKALAEHGLRLPIEAAGTLQKAIGWNEPNGWRNWVLAMTGITASGKVVKSGAQVTKSVAGFEIHKFVVGSRDAFLFPVDYTLRVIPTSVEPNLELQVLSNTELSDAERKLLIALKQRFDPTGKLNPGIWGFM